MSDQLNKRLGTKNVTWKLEDLYNSTRDPEIDNDITFCQTEAQRIQNEYSGRMSELTADEFYTLVSSLEKTYTIRSKLSTFAFLNFTTKTQDPKSGAFLQKVREESSKISKFTVFFELEWNAVDEEIAKKLLSGNKISSYRHYLQSLRRYAPHLLSRPEESLLIDLSPVGRGAWNLLFEKVMGNLKFGKNGRTEEEVLSDLYNTERTVRKTAAKELTEGLDSQLHILTHITNTLLADKMIDDNMRNYSTWVSSMNLYNELEDGTVDILIKNVTARYDIPARYYTLKRKLLNLPELFDYDRYAPLPVLPSKEISWDESCKLVLHAFNDFSPEMSLIAEKFFTKGWIHAPIISGKRGGAFAHPCIPQVHPYVMVNYTGNLRDVSTVAHELGHGVHQFLASDKGYLNSDTPLVLAETASVFAELLLFNHQLKLITNTQEKNAFIAQKLESIFATVFRQIAMNRFEDMSHNARRDHGELPPETLSKFWMSTQQEMFGDSVTLCDDYKIWWSYIPHFLNTPGYVYSYAFGELLVLALYAIYKQEGDKFVPKYLELLKAGGSASPYDLLQPFGVNLNDTSFWQDGLNVIDDMLKQIE